MIRWTVSIALAAPGSSHTSSGVRRHAGLAEGVEAQGHQPQRLERERRDGERADQDAVQRRVEPPEREAGEQEREREQPQVAEPDRADEPTDPDSQWRSSIDTNQTNPMATINAPTWLSGRRAQPANPLAMNDQPTNSHSTASSPKPSAVAATTITATPMARPTGTSARRRRTRPRPTGAPAQGCRKRDRPPTVTGRPDRASVRACLKRCSFFTTSTCRTSSSDASRTARGTSS